MFPSVRFAVHTSRCWYNYKKAPLPFSRPLSRPASNVMSMGTPSKEVPLSEAYFLACHCISL